jgi:WD40 repeat protein
MADVMISYAREDTEFVRTLAAALEAGHRTTWVDWTGLLPGAPVRQEIFDAIAEASAVVLVLSPDWVESTYCRQEFDQALHLRKRLLPILLRPVDVTKVPPQLLDIQWILFDVAHFADAVGQLQDAIDRDLARLKLHARLYRDAERWQPQRETSILLRGAELAEAEDWLAMPAAGEGEPTALHLEFIVASRAAETARMAAEAARRRKQLFGVTTLLGVAVVLAAVAFALHRTSEARRRTGQSRLLAFEALARAGTRLDDAMLLASHAHEIDPTAEARSALLRLVTTHERLDRMLHGATGAVEGVAVSPDSRFAAGGDSAGRVLLWSLDTGQLVARAASADVPAHGDADATDIVNAVAFDPGRPEVAAASMSGIVRLLAFDGSGLRERHRWQMPLPVQSLAYSHDGALLAVGDLNGTVHLQTPRQPDAPARTIAAPKTAPVLALAFDPGSTRLAIGRGDQDVWLHPLTDLTRGVPFAQDGRIAGLAFASQGAALVAAGDQRVRRWQLGAPAAPPQDVVTPQRILAVAAIDDGERLALGLENGEVHVVSASGSPIEVLRGHGGQVRSIAVQRDRLIAGSRTGRVLTWSLDVPSPLTLAAATLHRDQPSALVFAPSGALLASGDHGATLAVWDRGRATISLPRLADHVEGIDSLAFSPDGRHLAVGSEASGLIIWNVDRARIERPVDSALAGVSALAFGERPSPLIAVLKDSSVARLDLETSESTRVAPSSPIGRPMCNAVDPTRRRLAFGTNEGFVALVDIATGQYSRTPFRVQAGEVMGLAFRDNGRIIGAMSDGTLFDWNPARHDSPRLTASGLLRLTSLALAPHGGLAAVGTEDGQILLWDTRAWQEIGDPRQIHQQGVAELAFDRDGTTLASNSADGQVVLSLVDPAAWAALSCRRANRVLGSERTEFDLGDVAECRNAPAASRWPPPTLPPGLGPLHPRGLVPAHGRIVGN